VSDIFGEGEAQEVSLQLSLVLAKNFGQSPAIMKLIGRWEGEVVKKNNAGSIS
jgi:hypothetical protein